MCPTFWPLSAGDRDNVESTFGWREITCGIPKSELSLAGSGSWQEQLIHKTPATATCKAPNSQKRKNIMKTQSEGKLQTWDLILCDSQAVNLLSQALSYHPPLAGQNQAFVVGGWATRDAICKAAKGSSLVKARESRESLELWECKRESLDPDRTAEKLFSFSMRRPKLSSRESNCIRRSWCCSWMTCTGTQRLNMMRFLEKCNNWIQLAACRPGKKDPKASSLLSKTQRKHENMAHWLYHVVLNRHDRQTSLVLQPSQSGSAETPEKIGPPPRFHIYFRSPLLGLTVSLFERPYICYLCCSFLCDAKVLYLQQQWTYNLDQPGIAKAPHCNGCAT